jgi:hypothetical protein
MVIRDKDADAGFWKLRVRGGVTSSSPRASSVGFGAVFPPGIHNAVSIPGPVLVYRLAFNGDIAAGLLAVFQGASLVGIAG